VDPLEYDVTFDDLVRFQTWHVLRSPQFRRVTLVAQFGVPLVGLIVSALLVVGGVLPWWTLLPAALIAVVYVDRFPKAWRPAIGRRVDEEMRKRGEDPLLGRWRLAIDERGVLATRAGAETVVPWSAITDVVLDGESVYLHRAPEGAFIVPGRILADPERRRAFVERVSSLRGAAPPPVAG
jgi:hypothetical protein